MHRISSIILASASPRRSELLSTLGLEFRVAGSADLDEVAILKQAQGTLAERLCQLAVLKGEAASRTEPEALVISADTVVVLDTEVMGKPRDAAEARLMLARLSGQTHEVYTAVAVQRDSNNACFSACAVTCVTFHQLNAQQISNYISQARPFDKAGSYAIQGLGALLVAGIEGDYSNVVGLPLGLTVRLLHQAGVQHPLGEPLP